MLCTALQLLAPPELRVSLTPQQKALAAATAEAGEAANAFCHFPTILPLLCQHKPPTAWAAAAAGGTATALTIAAAAFAQSSSLVQQTVAGTRQMR
mmetsp:Transcript_30402/g.79102  ORF Transcript_30402/g.79102 Transcript_30402/m.79102 type:complete len:96 (+) Transcript_30402:152-439(+)